MGGSRGTSTSTASKWPSLAFFDGDTTLAALPTVYATSANFVTGILNSRNGNDASFSTYAPQTSEELSAISKMSTRGRNGNETIKKGKAHLVDVVDGEYLDGSRSEFQGMLSDVKTKAGDAFENEVVPGLGATLYLIGDPAPDNIAEDLSFGVAAKHKDRVEAALLEGNYRIERKRQVYVLGQGVVYSAQDMLDAELLRRSGLYIREYEQGKLEDTWNRTEGRYLSEIRRLEVLGNAIRSMIGTQEATTTPYYKPNPLVGVAGGAMTGAMLGSAFGPWGTAGGAVIGGVLGAISTQ